MTSATDHRSGATRESSPFHIWLDNVIGLAGASRADAEPHLSRLSLWFNAGEPAWMAADGLKQLVRGARLVARDDGDRRALRRMIAA